MAKRIKGDYPDTPIYTERAVQDRKLPAFFIGGINTSTEKKMNNHYRMNWQMEVRYQTPANSLGTYSKLNQMGMELTFLLDRIHLPTYEDGKYREQRGTNIDYKIDEGVLLFYVDYEMNVLRYEKPAPLMASLEVDEGIKEE